MIVVLLVLIASLVVFCHDDEHGSGLGVKDDNNLNNAKWIVNLPLLFREMHHNASSTILVDKREDDLAMKTAKEYVAHMINTQDTYTDGEIIDVIEHFFWGKHNGIAMELGALDGSESTHSMTVGLEKTMGWRRILIDGNPQYNNGMLKKSPNAFGVNACICENSGIVHYDPVEYTGGVLEFMSDAFMMNYHSDVWNAGSPHGNLSSVNWGNPSLNRIKEVHCIPLASILRVARTKHINFFLLDVEGGELQVIKGINWHHVRFDVICVETEESNRPPNYEAHVIEALAPHGYNAVATMGRNTWFLHKNFVPSSRPGIDIDCYGGFRAYKHKRATDNNLRSSPFFNDYKCSVTD